MDGVRDLSLSHLDTKICKNRQQKWNQDEKLRKKHLGCKKVNSVKVNAKKDNGQRKKSTPAPRKVNGQSELFVKKSTPRKSTVSQQLTLQKSTLVNSDDVAC